MGNLGGSFREIIMENLIFSLICAVLAYGSLLIGYLHIPYEKKRFWVTIAILSFLVLGILYTILANDPGFSQNDRYLGAIALGMLLSMGTRVYKSALVKS